MTTHTICNVLVTSSLSPSSLLRVFYRVINSVSFLLFSFFFFPLFPLSFRSLSSLPSYLLVTPHSPLSLVSFSSLLTFPSLFPLLCFPLIIGSSSITPIPRSLFSFPLSLRFFLTCLSLLSSLHLPLTHPSFPFSLFRYLASHSQPLLIFPSFSALSHTSRLIFPSHSSLSLSLSSLVLSPFSPHSLPLPLNPSLPSLASHPHAPSHPLSLPPPHPPQPGPWPAISGDSPRRARCG